MASLDMSLDDVIKNRRNFNRRGRGSAGPQFGRGRGRPLRGARAFGAPRRNVLGLNARSSAFTIAKSIRRTKSFPWQNDMLEDSLKAANLSGREFGTKLHLSNLDIGVTNDDIRELFSEFGELVRYAIHFNRNGRPSGTAEVVFQRRSDAFQALKRYNNVQLDGRPMRVEIVGDNAQPQTNASAHVNVVGGASGLRRTIAMPNAGPALSRGGITAANQKFNRVRGHGGVRGSIAGRGSVRGGIAGRGRGRGGARRGARSGTKWVKKSAEDLDKELDTYHAEAMES